MNNITPNPAASATVAHAARCPLCGATHYYTFLEIAAAPVLIGALWPTAAAARQAPTGAMQLVLCQACGFIYNRTFEPAKMVYAPGYEISLHHSPLYQAFAQQVAQHLIERYQLRHKTVIEIGCGPGYFLRTLCQLGQNRGVGFDPALAQTSLIEEDGLSLQLIQDYYTAAYQEIPSDLICCRSVLELIPNVYDFVSGVRAVIGERTASVVYFELPNAEFVFGGSATWNTFYEHCSYFTPTVLTRLFQRCGFQVIQAGACYDQGQYVNIEALPQRKACAEIAIDPDELAQLTQMVTSYATHYQQRSKAWQARLLELERTHQRVVTWGSGGRGITFLNTAAAPGQIDYVVDVNPDRQGKFIPKTGQQVVAPDFLLDYRPDVVIITNPTYAQEIKAQTQTMGISCEFLLS